MLFPLLRNTKKDYSLRGSVILLKVIEIYEKLVSSVRPIDFFGLVKLNKLIYIYFTTSFTKCGKI